MGKYLKFHEECMKTLELPAPGLCFSLHHSKKLLKFVPTVDDLQRLSNEGCSDNYWGSELGMWDRGREYNYGPLRQTIVLFMAAMNREFDKKKKK